MKEVPVKVGDVLAGKYRVDSILGVGGMGVVVEATHLELLEPRAIKLMLPEALENSESVERFLREARASSRLKSEYVARVHDVGKLDSGVPYMVMEHLHGSDLRHLIKERGRLPAPEAIHYALQACEALAEAHSMGIIHRDLKPANLFLTQRNDGTPCIKVLDFGISKVLGSADLEMTKTQAVLGSPSYMSPEQMRSARTVDARTDIWSLGVILYRLITGELPFRADSITELVTKVLQNAPRRPSTIVPEIPKELDEVLLRCFERDLTRRYANVGELSSALLPFAPSEARASIERIARVLAVASHGRGALPAFGAGGAGASLVDVGASTKGAVPRPRFQRRRLGQHLVRQRDGRHPPLEAVGARGRLRGAGDRARRDAPRLPRRPRHERRDRGRRGAGDRSYTMGETPKPRRAGCPRWGRPPNPRRSRSRWGRPPNPRRSRSRWGRPPNPRRSRSRWGRPPNPRRSRALLLPPPRSLLLPPTRLPNPRPSRSRTPPRLSRPLRLPVSCRRPRRPPLPPP